MIDNVHQIRIECMFETIDRTRSGASNKFWQWIIKQSNGTPPETIIGKCARSTNVYMRDNTISSSTFSMVPNPLLFSRHKLHSSVLVSSAESITLTERVYHCKNNHASQLYIYVSKYGVWVHVVNRRVFSRSNKYTFWEWIHDSTIVIFGYM